MSKKKNNETKFSKEDIQAALEILHSEYFMNVLGLLSHNEDVDLLDYVKVPVVTPNGGTYLVSVLHIDGPKVNLKALAEMTKSQVKD